MRIVRCIGNACRSNMFYLPCVCVRVCAVSDDDGSRMAPMAFWLCSDKIDLVVSHLNTPETAHIYTHTQFNLNQMSMHRSPTSALTFPPHRWASTTASRASGSKCRCSRAFDDDKTESVGCFFCTSFPICPSPRSSRSVETKNFQLIMKTSKDHVIPQQFISKI